MSSDQDSSSARERAAARADLDDVIARPGEIAVTILSSTPGSWRKCWPKRLRARGCMEARSGCLATVVIVIDWGAGPRCRAPAGARTRGLR